MITDIAPSTAFEGRAHWVKLALKTGKHVVKIMKCMSVLDFLCQCNFVLTKKGEKNGIEALDI